MLAGKDTRPRGLIGLRQTVFPVVRPSVLMHYRCNENPIGENFIKNRERKTTDEAFAKIGVLDRTGILKVCDPASGLLNSDNEVCAKARILIVEERAAFNISS